MTIFNLPDLGEGLPDAEIHEWFVQEGDAVKLDQPLVSMETAKAVVDVPSPQEGIVAKIFGKAGDIIKTGQPLVAFEQSATPTADKGTVVGKLEESHESFEDAFIIGGATQQRQSPKITPAVKLLAKKLGVKIESLQGSGEHGFITRADVEAAASQQQQGQPLPYGFEPLKGVRRAMLSSMVQSHQEVVPVSIFDEADIYRWPANDDITVRLIRAIVAGCQQEPALNAWFDHQHSARRCFNEVHLGLAIDSMDGLFVPVIHDVEQLTNEELRKIINEYKQQVLERSISAEKLKGATITLSNFGKFAGRFASPIIVPPMVAIIAVGRLYQGAVATENGQIESHPLLPLSLSFDHRAVSGGEATRFLGTVMKALEQE